MCEYVTPSREYDQAAHIYTLAWVACEYADMPMLDDVPVHKPDEYVCVRYSDGPKRIIDADRTWGAPFRAALKDWLWLVLYGDVSQSNVALWNNALESFDFAKRYNCDSKLVRNVLTYVEPPWAREALDNADKHLSNPHVDILRENVLVRAENVALRTNASFTPTAWARNHGLGHGKLRHQRYDDVGQLLAYAAWTADWVSNNWKGKEQ